MPPGSSAYPLSQGLAVSECAHSPNILRGLRPQRGPGCLCCGPRPPPAPGLCLPILFPGPSLPLAGKAVLQLARCTRMLPQGKQDDHSLPLRAGGGEGAKATDWRTDPSLSFPEPQLLPPTIPRILVKGPLLEASQSGGWPQESRGLLGGEGALRKGQELPDRLTLPR